MLRISLSTIETLAEHGDQEAVEAGREWLLLSELKDCEKNRSVRKVMAWVSPTNKIAVALMNL